MINAIVYLHNSGGKVWYKHEDKEIAIYLKGYAYYDGKLIGGDDLVEVFSAELGHTDKCNIHNFSKIIDDMNGSFSVIYKTNDRIFAAVDKVRSIPLFYGIEDNQVYLSDDGNFIKTKMGSSGKNIIQETEFMLTGYVTGSETLHSDIFQLQAAECLYVNGEGINLQKVTMRYYAYYEKSYTEKNISDLHSEHDAIINRVFLRLLKSLNGKPVVIPLSGGLDSRLIACMFRKYNYDNVICFSYGIPNNTESVISKMVAKQLGFPWVFVEYSHKKWYDLIRSSYGKEYLTYLQGISSVAHVQDWPAVYELKNKGMVPKDSIFIPGHSFDFLGGSHIPEKLFYGHDLGIDDLVESIISRHYTLWDISQQDTNTQIMLKEKILTSFSDISMENRNNLISAFECWVWQERQAKFIVNSCRVYEYWGFDWRIPLWDDELIHYWSKIPPNKKYRRKMLRQYLSDFIFKQHNVDFENNNISDISKNDIYLSRKVFQYVRDLLQKNTIYKNLRKNIYYRHFKSKQVYKNDPLGWFGIMDKHEFSTIYSGEINITSILVLERLGKIDL